MRWEVNKIKYSQIANNDQKFEYSFQECSKNVETRVFGACDVKTIIVTGHPIRGE